MNYEITLRNKNKIIIDNDEYEKIKANLNRVKLYTLKSGVIVNSAEIILIEPSQQPTLIVKEFRLPAMDETTQTSKEKDIKMMKVIAGMEGLFNKLKKQGLFKDFENYQDWELKKVK